MAAELPPLELRHEEAPCGLLVTEPNGTIVEVNRTFCRWIGYERDDLLDRQTLQGLLTVGGRIFHQTHWAPLLHMQGSVAEVKLDFRHADGRRIPCVINAKLREWAGQTLHEVAVFVAEDRHKYEAELVKERKRTEELLKESEASARSLREAEAVLQNALAQLQIQAEEAAIRAKFAEQMMGIVSHDLRNPLSTLRLVSELLLRAPSMTEDKLKDMAKRMRRAVDAGDRLIADMLDFTAARIGKGIAVTLKQINLHEVVAQALADLAVRFPEREFRHAKIGDSTTMADPDRISQLLGNLVVNALTYGSTSEPIDVLSEARPESALVTVVNQGVPIEPELIPKLFEPMTRGESADHGHRSVGLGLFIVSEIARAHSGRVIVESSPQRGTRFTVLLPQVSTLEIEVPGTSP